MADPRRLNYTHSTQPTQPSHGQYTYTTQHQGYSHPPPPPVYPPNPAQQPQPQAYPQQPQVYPQYNQAHSPGTEYLPLQQYPQQGQGQYSYYPPAVSSPQRQQPQSYVQPRQPLSQQPQYTYSPSGNPPFYTEQGGIDSSAQGLHQGEIYPSVLQSPLPVPTHIYSTSVDPADLFQQAPPSHSLPSPPSTTVRANCSIPRILLRAPRQSSTSTPTAEMPARPSGSRSSVAVKEEAIFSVSGRPQRGAGQRAVQQLQQARYDDDEEDEDEEDAEGTQGDEGEDESLPIAPELLDEGRRRSRRDRKPPTSYADQQAAQQDISPVLRGPKRGNRRKVIDPDESAEGEGVEDDYAVGRGTVVQPPRLKFPPRPGAAQGRQSRTSLPIEVLDTNGDSSAHSNVRTTRSSRAHPPTPAKSRASSADAESFHPDQSDDLDADGDPDVEGDGSPDPLEGHYEEEDDSDSSGGYGRNVRTRGRNTKKPPPRRAAPSQGGGTRRSARTLAATRSFGTDDDDEEFTTVNKRNLRTRAPVNYQLPPADISTEITQAEMLREAVASASRPGGGRGTSGRGGAGAGVRFGAGAGGFGNKSLAWGLGVGRGGAGGFARAMGDDSSDSDDLMTPLKPTSGAAAGSSAAGGLVGGPKISAPTDVKDFGRVNPKSSTADADPLGVDMNITFDNVGGLDGHIDQLKEMVALPLLYPEVFQQFGITPPRGVLFHGPPGTGKTLLARALAASCSNGNTKISFFMRKGADVLSKWVGEAERQLRMLFDEARAAQPSIIFFDEIDGLAPVRSSKQDQIHASLVSTLLALMDGMDGRGQVIVIGATNRPDSVDPALRRPGRFDREFYFPLPNKEARKKIIQINTKVWNPPLEDGLVEMLAGVTKGYGGADMRALCTEAALNAIQRRYPQIYKSTDRFELDTSSIQVKAKDFLMSVKKIIPSSARSTTSTAIPLPMHLVPLLTAPLDRLKAAVDNVLPRHKDRTALEEAMYEEDDGDLAGAEILQTLDRMRTHRPRVLVSGTVGMGQTYLGPAILHHLEGFHVQNFDLGILLSDSSRTVEAALVQLFIEAKRHQPSILYIPALNTWSNTLSDSAKATFKSLLDGIQPSEPILLLGLAEDGEVREDVRDWFGWDEDGAVELVLPSMDERAEYFSPLITHINTPPNMWPDALPRRPRVLEQLKIAAPLPPRQPTEAELAKERERDLNARNMMVLSFTGLVGEFARKYKRVVASVREDAFMLHAAMVQNAAEEAAMAAADAAGETDVAEAVETETPNVPVVDITAATDAGTPMPNGRTGSLPPNSSQLTALSDLSMSNSQPLLSANGESSSQPFSTQGLLPDATQASSVLTDLTSSQPPRTFSALLGPDAAVTAPSTQSSTQPLVPDIAPSSAPAGPKQPDWTPNDIDTDTLSRRLAKHKYHRPADFLADIDRIKANADKIGDVDRQNKVAEMASHAYLHVAEFDPRWGPEFDAYAERMRGRKEKRDEERKRKDVEVEGEKSGEGDSGDKGKKRARDEGTDGDVEMADGDTHPEKRVRMEDEDVSPNRARTSSPVIDLGTSTSSATAKASTPIPTPAPAPVYPPFIVPSSKLADFTHALKNDTGDFTVEDLEQLRAGLFGRIWKRRGDWDRGELIDELCGFLGKMVRGHKGRNGD